MCSCQLLHRVEWRLILKVYFSRQFLFGNHLRVQNRFLQFQLLKVFKTALWFSQHQLIRPWYLNFSSKPWRTFNKVNSQCCCNQHSKHSDSKQKKKKIKGNFHQLLFLSSVQLYLMITKLWIETMDSRYSICLLPPKHLLITHLKFLLNKLYSQSRRSHFCF